MMVYIANSFILLMLTTLSKARLCPRPECPQDFTETKTILLPSEDCSQFYECTTGFPTKLQCPPKLRFSEKSQGCVVEENADCSPCEEEADPNTGVPEVENDDNWDINNYFPFLYR